MGHCLSKMAGNNTDNSIRKTDTKMKQTEHQLQVSCVNWFKLQYPKMLIWATPNGGQRNVVVASKLKAEGALAGVPDLFIPHSRGMYHGLFIEMKVGKNQPTSSQKNVMSKLLDNGYKCEVCYTIEGFIETVKDYLK